MKNKVFSEIRNDLRAGSITCIQLVEQYLGRIEEKKHLNAFLEVFRESALLKAKEVDQKIRDGKAGKLAGMVIGLKDNICYKGHHVSASSHILEGFTSLYNATVTERLLNEDAIIIGRLNCDEFAMGSSNETSFYGKVRNPLNENCVPGGSSGGSAVAVAAGMCTAALGSDTGGSIRQPASFTGTFGFKPTYGRVSRYGLLAYASSFDQIGPITNNVEDAALILEVMAGKDEHDSTISLSDVPAYSEKLDYKGKARIAYIRECLESPGLNEEVKKATLDLLDKLRAEGHTVEPVDFPFLDYLVPTYYVLTTAEASSNLARYDGIHYGYRSKQSTDVDSTYRKSRTEGFGKEVKRRIMLGTFILSAGYYDAYYTKGLKVRRIIRDKTRELLKSYDFILTPTTPNVAFEFGQKSSDPVEMYLEDIFTVQANLAGVPAISIPLAKNAKGMPFGVQLMASDFNEEGLLAFSSWLENKNLVNA
jgi:aspartyl-tRNA(Asn)/glutamyl-tRNA(Gln) amidotransferase subunit A